MKKVHTRMRKLLSMVLTVCLLVTALAVPALAKDNDYSDIISIYVIEGLDKKANTYAFAYMYGSPKNDPSENYAFVLKGNYRGFLLDLVSGDKVDQMSKTAISVSRMDVNNFNEFLLASGFDDDMILIPKKPAIINDLKKALTEHKTALRTTNTLYLNPDVLNLAKQSGDSNFRIHCDNVEKKSVDVRLTVTPSKTTKGIITVAMLDNPDVIKRYANTYSNKFVAIDFFQEGSFGTIVDVAAKVDLTGLDTSSLDFYSYNMLTNKQRKIENPNYTIDEKGYLHFSTDLGGTIMITDKPLTKK